MTTDYYYELGAELNPAHSGDVKALASVGNGILVTASRDSSVAVWKRNKESVPFELVTLLRGHGAYVNSLAYIPSLEENPNYIASGGNSNVILLHNLDSLNIESEQCLLGHSLNVCALNYSVHQQKLISGSWDCTARVWSCDKGKWKSGLVLEGHAAAVWDVKSVDCGPNAGCILTCSADRLINLWSDKGQLLNRFKGSPEPVRSLAVIPDGSSFVSACNDGLLRLWDFSGRILQTMSGHTDYAYRVDLGIDGEITSCGEDHTARVWREGKQIGVIPHPCQTVWCVASLPNGDIVTGGSDGKVRIWSKAQERIASRAVRDAYARELPVEAIQHETANSFVKFTTEKFATPAALTIDIDLSDDDPPIPLIYDINTDPRTAAEDFGKIHHLSENYIMQIEAFIRKHL